ncbi:VOC family protein [Solirhodobacter olei]|uniref:VOC family protein n=1 Tax=Solirhodobacter olei TaxID=2493082 RepID=UPI000FDB8097|nr:VOC family protein [Solirhodobacter olei]
MIDHLGFPVADYALSRTFYERALAPLSLSVVMEVTPEQTGGERFCGFGAEHRPFFWIGTGKRPGSGMHVAFAAKTRAEVDAFHKAALAAGGRDNGAPGLRPQYHPSYYGAFVLDPDGNNVEAVCHAEE